MNPFRSLFFLLAMLAWRSEKAFSQTDSLERWVFNGYLKNLQTWTFSDERNSLITGGFFHNRLNLKWLPNQNWTASVELRNRLFYGEWVRYQPGWADILDTDSGWADLSFVPVERPALIASVIVDRLWAQWRQGRWSLRAGRQRINWAVALTWNPNDWFNAWNFLEFDYEERPGADALRVQYQTGGFSSLDFAVSPAHDGNATGAMRVSGNVRQYDWHAQAGVYRKHFAAGVGWAGNLGEAGFKGEVSVFQPFEDTEGNTSVSATAGVDVTFDGTWFVNGGFLINSNGVGGDLSIIELSQYEFGPDNLMPGKFSVIAGASHTFTPLLQASFSAVYSPNGNLTILIPTAAYSISDSWDIDLTGQLFWLNNEEGVFENAQNSLFLRLKWSF